MGKSTTEIRGEIETTRDEMEETVDALGYKLDVKERTKEKVSGLAHKPMDAVMRVKDAVTEHTPDTSVLKPNRITGSAKHALGGAKDKAQTAGTKARGNPTAVALGGFAVGVLAGLAVPTTKVEDEKLGPIADQVKDAVKETGAEAIEHGKDIAQSAEHSAIETVKDEGKTHADELAESAKTKAREVTQSSGSSGF